MQILILLSVNRRLDHGIPAGDAGALVDGVEKEKYYDAFNYKKSYNPYRYFNYSFIGDFLFRMHKCPPMSKYPPKYKCFPKYKPPFKSV